MSTSTGHEATIRKIFVVDDHPIVRQGLVQMINGQPDLMVCGQGDDAAESLAAIKAAKPDLVLLDVSLKGGDGIELVKQLKSFDPGLLVLMLSMHDESTYAERALHAGASGYIMKQEAPQALLAAVRKILGGGVYVSEKMGAVLLGRTVRGKKYAGTMPMERLTDRELEVFGMIGSGLTVKEISDKLTLSTKTVEAHREHIKEKLNLNTGAELVRFAIQNSPQSP